MIAVDTNILVYAHRTDSPFHDRARSVLESLAAGPRPWATRQGGDVAGTGQCALAPTRHTELPTKIASIQRDLERSTMTSIDRASGLGHP